MNLAIDIGNTRTKTGLFAGRALVEQAIWQDWALQDLLDYGREAGVDRVITSSVAIPDPETQHILRKAFVVALELTAETPLPFQNNYRTPETLGRDRLAAVAGAQALFAGQNCLVVDCGTCIKYDFIDRDTTYHGGNIAPGALMRIRAMHTFTARLPEVPLQMPENIIGNSTETALQNGALMGAVLEITGFVHVFQVQFGLVNVLLTGGDAAFFAPHLSIPGLRVEPNLTLHGLNHILQYNADQNFIP